MTVGFLVSFQVVLSCYWQSCQMSWDGLICSTAMHGFYKNYVVVHCMVSSITHDLQKYAKTWSSLKTYYYAWLL